MLDNLKNEVYLNLEELFTGATVDEMTNDIAAYKKKLKDIARIAEILGVKAEITTVNINIKTGKSS